jgi:hypothetical protein
MMRLKMCIKLMMLKVPKMLVGTKNASDAKASMPKRRVKRTSSAFIVLFLALYPLAVGAQTHACTPRPLNFGNLLPGQSRQVDKYDATRAMCYKYEQTSGSRIIRFNLPGSVSYAGSYIPIFFLASDGAYSYTTTYNSWGPDNFNPYGQFNVPYDTKVLYIRLGASINVPYTLPSGVYQGTIQITINSY